MNESKKTKSKNRQSKKMFLLVVKLGYSEHQTVSGYYEYSVKMMTIVVPKGIFITTTMI